jgi:anaerobic magnesium-protoporphyrin IX monomethyl ester cyclase
MNILLTHAYYLYEDEKEISIMKPYAPLGLLYISAFLKQNSIQHEVYDSTFFSFEAHTTYLNELKPDAIGIYVNLMTKLNVLKLIHYIKNSEQHKHCKIILGGPELRHYKTDYLNFGADFVVIGEGENTFYELIQALVSKTDFTAIDGIAFKSEKGEIIETKERVLIKNIDVLDFPNRASIDITKYLNAWKTAHGDSSMSVSTMRGCPYTCKWCSRAVYGGTYRRRSPDLVAEELLSIKNTYHPDSIWFVDDVFTISHKWLEQFVMEVKNKNAIIPYEAITRADRLNESVLKLLKESGCKRIWIGAESGSQRIIDAMDRRVDVMQVRAMIKLAKRFGIEAGTFLMVGYPGETKKDIKQTIEHLTDSQPDFYTLTIAYPIKGTTLYNEVKNDITVLPNFNEGTDRNIDFKRTHSKKYYDYAIRWIHNEVNYSKESNLFKKFKFKSKSIASEILMGWEK